MTRTSCGVPRSGDARATTRPLNPLFEGHREFQEKQRGVSYETLPLPQASRYASVARQVTVKHTYSLWVTQAEKDAMIRVLSTCPNQPLPDGTNPVPLAIAPSPMTPPAPEDVYYPNCAAARAAGAAPLYRGEPGYRTDMDGDDDGIACE